MSNIIITRREVTELLQNISLYFYVQMFSLDFCFLENIKIDSICIKIHCFPKQSCDKVVNTK